ncbi:MAG: hypothetical protein QNJ47_26535 [Nostocaceae cyanobacterium]|nr:hypothetical protein [Nostocaceae cyanobacterium]
MNYSYQYWERQFLTEKAIEYGFKKNHYIAFIERLVLENRHLTNGELITKLDSKEKIKNYYPEKMIADSWNKEIYPTLKINGFDFKSEDNPHGQYKKSYEGVTKWLKEEVFPEYIKTIYPSLAIEVWQDLWEKAEENQEIISVSKHQKLCLDIQIDEDWNDKESDGIPIGSKIKYEFNLNGYEYLIVVTKFVSGDFYCLVPSKFSPVLPVDEGQVSIPQDNFFRVKEPRGYEQIIAVLCEDEPLLDWLPKYEEYPLKLETNHLVDILNYVHHQNCLLTRYKYLIV